MRISWERPLHQGGADLAVGPGGLVVHERSTRLVSLDPEDGSVRWDVRTTRWPRAIVLAGQRCLVLPQDPDELVCLDLGTGEDVWRVGLRPLTGHLVVDGDVALVGGWRGYTPLRAVDLTTGRTLWETWRRMNTVRPAAGGGGFLVGEPGDLRVRLIGRRDGRKLHTWSLPRPLADHDHSRAFTAVGGGRFVVRCGDGTVVRLDPSAATASDVVVAARPLVRTSPRHVGGLLWLRELGDGFTVADPADGRVVWRFDVGQPLIGDVVAEDPGRFVVAGLNGVLYFVDADGRLVERVGITRRLRGLRPLGPGRVLALTKGTLLAASIGTGARRR